MIDAPDGYEAFALAYDRALGQPFFSSLSRRLEDLTLRFPAKKPRHLDVACGTGLLLEWATRRGWDSIGVDASTAMLELARERGGRVVCGDMRALPVSGATFDRITCMYDSLNHLLEKDDVRSTFAGIASLMHERSVFWFDVNHLDAYTSIWATDDPFESLGDDWELYMATSYDASSRIATAHVTGYATIRDERVMIDEVHQQRPWADAAIRDGLREAGLRVAWKTRFEPFGTGGESNGLKVLYAAVPAGGE